MFHTHSFSILTILLFNTLLIANTAFAAAPVYTSYFSDVAASGYDVVSYFTQQQPMKGTSKYSTAYNGAEWHFSSQENLNLFKSAPKKFAPQYGGYCAWAAAYNKTAKGDPLQWAIHNDKLYLNYNADIKAKWSADKDQLIKKADLFWPNLTL